MLKRVFFFCLVLTLVIFGESFGQRLIRQQPRRAPLIKMNRAASRRMEMLKENFIGSKLKLTSAEAKNFWPVYHQYVEEQTSVRIKKRENNSTTSADGTQQIDKELEYESQLVSIRKHYRDEFLRVLPPEKVSEIYKSEREFTDEVLRQLSERSVRAGD